MSQKELFIKLDPLEQYLSMFYVNVLRYYLYHINYASLHFLILSINYLNNELKTCYLFYFKCFDMRQSF